MLCQRRRVRHIKSFCGELRGKPKGKLYLHIYESRVTKTMCFSSQTYIGTASYNFSRNRIYKPMVSKKSVEETAFDYRLLILLFECMYKETVTTVW